MQKQMTEPSDFLGFFSLFSLQVFSSSVQQPEVEFFPCRQ